MNLGISALKKSDGQMERKKMSECHGCQSCWGEQLSLWSDEEWAELMNHFNKLEGSDLNEVPEV